VRSLQGGALERSLPRTGFWAFFAGDKLCEKLSPKGAFELG